MKQPDVLEMVALYEAGHSTTEIAKRIGLHQTTVHRLLRNFGVQMRRRGRPKGNSTVPVAVVREAMALYQAGHSLSEVGKRIRYPQTTIYRWLKEAAVRMRPPGTRKSNSTAAPASAVRQAVAFYQAGHSLTEVAERVGYHLSTVHKWLKDADVAMRRRGASPGSGNPDYIVEVKRRLQSGETIATIAVDYGVSRQAISALAKYHGFPIKQLRQAER